MLCLDCKSCSLGARAVWYLGWYSGTSLECAWGRRFSKEAGGPCGSQEERCLTAVEQEQPREPSLIWPGRDALEWPDQHFFTLMPGLIWPQTADMKGWSNPPLNVAETHELQGRIAGSGSVTRAPRTGRVLGQRQSLVASAVCWSGSSTCCCRRSQDPGCRAAVQGVTVLRVE